MNEKLELSYEEKNFLTISKDKVLEALNIQVGGIQLDEGKIDNYFFHVIEEVAKTGTHLSVDIITGDKGILRSRLLSKIEEISSKDFLKFLTGVCARSLDRFQEHYAHEGKIVVGIILDVVNKIVEHPHESESLNVIIARIKKLAPCIHKLLEKDENKDVYWYMCVRGLAITLSKAAIKLDDSGGLGAYDSRILSAVYYNELLKFMVSIKIREELFVFCEVPKELMELLNFLLKEAEGRGDEKYNRIIMAIKKLNVLHDVMSVYFEKGSLAINGLLNHLGIIQGRKEELSVVLLVEKIMTRILENEHNLMDRVVPLIVVGFARIQLDIKGKPVAATFLEVGDVLSNNNVQDEYLFHDEMKNSIHKFAGIFYAIGLLRRFRSGNDFNSVWRTGEWHEYAYKLLKCIEKDYKNNVDIYKKIKTFIQCLLHEIRAKYEGVEHLYSEFNIDPSSDSINLEAEEFLSAVMFLITLFGKNGENGNNTPELAIAKIVGNFFSKMNRWVTAKKTWMSPEKVKTEIESQLSSYELFKEKKVESIYNKEFQYKGPLCVFGDSIMSYNEWKDLEDNSCKDFHSIEEAFRESFIS